MLSISRIMLFKFAAILLPALALLAAGCGGSSGGGGGTAARSDVTLLFSGDTTGTQSTGARGVSLSRMETPIPVEDILSLTIEVNRILFKREDAAEDDADEDNVVRVIEGQFDPTSLQVEPGETVTWIWQEAVAHTVTSGAPGDLDSGSVFDGSGATVGAEFAHTFSAAGTFPYFSDNTADIANGMAGTIVVEDNGDAVRAVIPRDHLDAQGVFVTIWEGMTDVNLLDLSGLSEVISRESVPAGEYKGIVLEISNPRLVLRSNPDQIITAVQLTANGRLFLKDSFTLLPGGDVVIVLDFGGIHLVQTGPGTFVLAPQLRVEIGEDDEDAEITGQILSINPDTASFLIAAGARQFAVLTDGDTVFLDDFENPSSFGALVAGQIVEVEGLIDSAATILARKVEIEDEEAVEVRGVITSLAARASMVTIETATGPLTFSVVSTTRLEMEGDIPITFDRLQVGQGVEAELIDNGDDTSSAGELELLANVTIFGQILSKNEADRTIVVQTDLTNRTVEIPEGAEIRDGEVEDLGFVDLTPGRQVEVKGAEVPGDVLLARRIEM